MGLGPKPAKGKAKPAVSRKPQKREDPGSAILSSASRRL